MIIMAVKAVGFDFDGTLVNSLGEKVKNAGIVYSQEFGVDPKNVETSYKKYSGVSRRFLFDKIAEQTINRKLSEEEYNRLSNKFDKLNSSVIVPERLYPDTVKVLVEQKNKGRILYISSSVPHSVLNESAASVGISKYFNEIMGLGFQGTKGVGHTKYIIKKYGLTKEEIVFVGDELPDIDLSKEAGIRVISVTNTLTSEELINRGAYKTISKLSELEAVLVSIEPD